MIAELAAYAAGVLLLIGAGFSFLAALGLILAGLAVSNAEAFRRRP